MTAWSAMVRARRGDFVLDVALEGDARTVAVVGPNGSGKTTLLRALAGAVGVEAAKIVVGGLTLADSAAGLSLPMEQRGVGYVPQGYGLFPHLSVLENVAFGLAARQTAEAERAARARAMLDELGCAGLEARRPGSLSGGEQQRVALARALVVEPRLLLMDEPLAALDAAVRREVRASLAARLAARGRPTLIVTHDARDVRALDARVVVLDRGRVVQEGSLDELEAEPANAFVAEFVGVE